MMETEIAYFQYYPELELPIYLKIDGILAAKLSPLLSEMKFKKVPVDFKPEVSFAQGKKFRTLLIREAGPKLALQIGHFSEGDSYSSETLTPKSGFSIYRFRGRGLMVYSLHSREWELGILLSSTNPNDNKESLAIRIMLNRFLSWSLMEFGYVGLWGVPVDEGIVVMTQKHSHGEAIFINCNQLRLLTIEGEKKIKGIFQILRLDQTIHGRTKVMLKEELFSFLCAHTTYFDYLGIPVGVRQMIELLSKTTQGVLLPKENFRPRRSSLFNR